MPLGQCNAPTAVASWLSAAIGVAVVVASLAWVRQPSASNADPGTTTAVTVGTQQVSAPLAIGKLRAVSNNGIPMFFADAADRCADSLWSMMKIDGSIAEFFEQPDKGWSNRNNDCLTSPHSFWLGRPELYPVLTNGRYFVKLRLRRDGYPEATTTLQVDIHMSPSGEATVKEVK
jgi:hypothetical protein